MAVAEAINLEAMQAPTIQRVHRHIDENFGAHLERCREFLRQKSISATGEGIKDPEILSVSNKVGYRMDDACDLKYGTGYCPAKMEIKLKNGRTLFGEQGGGRYGHPERPVSKADLMEKFRECVAYSARPLSAATVDKISAMVDKLEEVDDVSEIIRLVS